MRICRVFPNFQTDLWYAEHYIAKELFKKGYKTTFISSAKYPDFWKPYMNTIEGIGYFKHEYFDIFRVKSIYPLEKTIYTNWIQLYRLIYVKNKFNVIHILTVGSFSTIIVLFLDKFNRKNRPKIIISDHTTADTNKRNGRYAKMYYFLFKIMFKIMGKRVSKIVSFDTESIDLLSKRFGIDKKRFKIIPLGFDQENFFNFPEKRNVSPLLIIGFAGKLDLKKRIDVLFESVAASKNKSNIKIIIGGFKENDNYCNFLAQTSKKLNLNVEFRPFFDKKGLANFYQYINLAVFPGSISITTIEANGCGTPIILFESIKGLKSRVENGRGLLFDDIHELTKLIDYYFNLHRLNLINYKDISFVTAQTSSWSKISDDYRLLYQK